MKNLIWVAVVIVVVVVGLVLFSLSNGGKNETNNINLEFPLAEDRESTGETNNNVQTVEVNSEIETNIEDIAVAESQKVDPKFAEYMGSYEAYSPEKLSEANTGDVILFFRASWCPTCRTLDNDIRSNLSSIPVGVTILDVNYDAETALKQKYGVTYQHTLVQVNSDGSIITKWSGSPTLASLLQSIK